MSSESKTPNIIWMDCEMTGLFLEKDALVEIGVLVTDSELNLLGDGVSVVIKASDEQLEQMGDFVRNMHQESGLLEEIPDGLSLEMAQEQVLQYLRQHCEPGKSPLAGNTVGMDRNFIARDMPELHQFIHYRTIDVSSIKELARRWYPKAYFTAPEKTGNHRALADIQDSIAELVHYRTTIFKDGSSGTISS
ncbi:MAG: oligoribonuclease [Actinobacteria bacterium]|nr:oligoribonuclease [Actinomycetota bacterium]